MIWYASLYLWPDSKLLPTYLLPDLENAKGPCTSYFTLTLEQNIRLVKLYSTVERSVPRQNNTHKTSNKQTSASLIYPTNRRCSRSQVHVWTSNVLHSGSVPRLTHLNSATIRTQLTLFMAPEPYQIQLNYSTGALAAGFLFSGWLHTPVSHLCPPYWIH